MLVRIRLQFITLIQPIILIINNKFPFYKQQKEFDILISYPIFLLNQLNITDEMPLTPFSQFQKESSLQQQQSLEQQQLTQFLSPPQFVLFQRMNNHLLFHFIPLAQFWQTPRLCVTLQQFQRMLQKIKFNKGRDQLQQMRQHKIEFVSLDKVLEGVSEWKRHEKDIATFMERQNEYIKSKSMNDNGNLDSHVSPYKRRVKSKINNGALGSNINTELKYQIRSQKSYGLNSRATNQSNHPISKNYLAQTSQRQNSALNQLNSTLIRTRNESHYQLAIKVGELNDICKKLKNDLQYVIVTKDGNEMIQIQEKQGKSADCKVISEKMFHRKYQQLKTLTNNMMEEIEGTLEKDLRETLVEVMFLSDQLQKQIALLKRKGVNC